MKYLDKVKVLTDDYEKHNVKRGDVGAILLSAIRKETFYVVFSSPNGQDYADIAINIKI